MYLYSYLKKNFISVLILLSDEVKHALVQIKNRTKLLVWLRQNSSSTPLFLNIYNTEEQLTVMWVYLSLITPVCSCFVRTPKPSVSHLHNTDPSNTPQCANRPNCRLYVLIKCFRFGIFSVFGKGPVFLCY